MLKPSIRPSSEACAEPVVHPMHRTGRSKEGKSMIILLLLCGCIAVTASQEIQRIPRPAWGPLGHCPHRTMVMFVYLHSLCRVRCAPPHLGQRFLLGCLAQG